jgi:Ni,Fe-hydrogenase III small subunit/NAD-dependent dihydropyrimidine dehydrogenase PreA subunit
MLKIIYERMRQKRRTIAYPRGPEPVLPERFRGLPTLTGSRCGGKCRACERACPTGAVRGEPRAPSIDLGACLFCGECARACPSKAIAFTRGFRLEARTKEDLIVGENGVRLAESLDRKARSLFGRSLRLRQVSAGGCAGCEVDVAVLQTVVFDLARFGVEFVASPRHADGLLVTGPVTRNMELAVRKSWEAVPSPRLVIAVGACAISGGPWRGLPESLDGAASLLPVDLFIPGCPPHPLTTLDGILRLLGRIDAPALQRP